MKHGFTYLTAIMDLYNHYIVGRQLSNSFEKETHAGFRTQRYPDTARTISRHGKLEIINSDQRAQYTCEHWASTLSDLKTWIGMDREGRTTDNAYIERLFRTTKQKYPLSEP